MTMTEMTTRLSTAFAFALASTACEGDRVPGSAAVRDSAGIAIVENSAAMWKGEPWRFADRPTLDIGVVSGDPAYELHEPRTAVRLSDGRIVVADNGSLQLRYYAEDGSHLTDAGGRGGGPGEFNRISRVFRLEGDSIAVYDQTQRRVTVFDPEARFVRTMTLRRSDRLFFPMIEGRMDDGSYVGLLTLRQNADSLPDGISRDSVMLLQFGTDGEVLDTLGTFPNRMRDVQMRSIGDRRFRGPADVAFSPRTVWTLDEDRVYIGTSDHYEIRVYGGDATLRRIIRKEHEALPVTVDDRQNLWLRWREIHAGRLDNPEVKYFLKTIQESPLPEAFPAFDPEVRDDRGRRVGAALVVDHADNLWVLEYRRPGQEVPRWSVFDPLGRFLGIVTGPANFNVTEIGEDYILGWWTDALDVAHVLLYELITDRP